MRLVSSALILGLMEMTRGVRGAEASDERRRFVWRDGGGLYRVVSSVTVSRHCVHGSCVAVSLAGLCIRLLVLVRMGSGQAVGHNY